MEYYIYILRCQDNSLYTGIAKNYEKRFFEHLSGKGAKYTRSHKAKKIEVIFLAKNKSEASIVESFIKKKKKKDKENIIVNPNILIENIKKVKHIKIILKNQKNCLTIPKNYDSIKDVSKG